MSLARLPLRCALLPALRSAGGHVVFINSGAGINASPGLASYTASKFALRGFADSLRNDEPSLRVTSVHPGRIATVMQEGPDRLRGPRVRPDAVPEPGDRRQGHRRRGERAARRPHPRGHRPPPVNMRLGADAPVTIAYELDRDRRTILRRVRNRQGLGGCEQYCHPGATFTPGRRPRRWTPSRLYRVDEGPADSCQTERRGALVRRRRGTEQRDGVRCLPWYPHREGGPVPPTGKSAQADYVYVMEFDGDRIRHMTKIWNDGITCASSAGRWSHKRRR